MVVLSGSHLVILINIIQRHKVQSNICHIYFTMVHWFYRRRHFYTFSSYCFYVKLLMFCDGHLWFLINIKYKTNLEEGPCKVQLKEFILSYFTLYKVWHIDKVIRLDSYLFCRGSCYLYVLAFNTNSISDDVLSSNSSKTGITCGSGTANPSGVHPWSLVGFVLLNL